MFTCPQCYKEVHHVCGNKDCRCWQGIPEGELPMKWVFLLHWKKGKSIDVPHFIYQMVWDLCLFFKTDPYNFVFELEQCPYCGLRESIDYWEERSMEEAFYAKEKL
jgi:hypothetical protein